MPNRVSFREGAAQKSSYLREQEVLNARILEKGFGVGIFSEDSARIQNKDVKLASTIG